MFRNRVSLASDNWRGALKEIKALVDEKAKYGNLFTAYEQAAARDAIQETRTRLGSVIGGGGYGEMMAAREYQKKLIDTSTRSKQNEINRWDAGKLKAEMDLVAARIAQSLQSGAGPQGGGYSGASEGGTGGGNVQHQLAGLAAEYRGSGDIIKQRAFAEVVRGRLAGGAGLQDTNARITASGLANQAEDDLRALRVTPEMKAAAQAESDGWHTLAALREEVRQAAILLDGLDPAAPFAQGGPLANAYKSVKFSPDGSKAQILEMDDPEITGFTLPPMPTGGTEVK